MINLTTARLRHLVAVAGISLTCMAAPAAAASDAQAQVKATAVASSVAAMAGERPAKKYCIADDSSTGTRLPKKVCKTEAEWRAEGVDINGR